MRRLLMVQYGDYAAALRAREAGEPETYRAQYGSLEAVDAVVDGGECLVVCLDAMPGRAKIGQYAIVADHFEPRGFAYRLKARFSARRILRHVRDFGPTHAVIRTPGWPLAHIGGWCLGRNIPVLPLLADYFRDTGLRARLRQRSSVGLMNDSRVPLVGNHNYPACRSLVRAGVDGNKVVPWDWPQDKRPHDQPVKELVPGRPLRIFYAGMVIREKGVFELVEAVARMAAEGQDVHLDICGHGADMEALRQRIGQLLTGERITLHGQVPNPTVRRMLEEATIAVVPSRHSYPEGLPNTIYEALETRTPAVLSDHPTFVERLRNDQGCLFFGAGSAEDLTRTIVDAVQSGERYAQLSHSTLEAWEAIQCPVTFARLLADWADWTVSGGIIPCLRHAVRESA